MLLKPVVKIKGLLKKSSRPLVVVLLSIGMLGCGHAKLKRDVEIWLIDREELLLYRKIDGGNEQVIPLQSKSMDRFMCMDKKEARAIINEIIERD